jgi:hypothetical protein
MVADVHVEGFMLNEESFASCVIFKDMAKKGMLTTNSQEGCVDSVKDGHVDAALYREVLEELRPTMEDEMSMRENKRWSKEQINIWDEEYKRRGGRYVDGVVYEKAYLWGLMLCDHARKVADAFNMLSNKIAMVVDVVDEVTLLNEHAYSIPVTFTRFNSGVLSRFTRAYAWQSRESHVLDVEEHGLAASEADRLSHIVFIDPSPGRKARSKQGLYVDVMKALESYKLVGS